jgi:hypothetical protein
MKLWGVYGEKIIRALKLKSTTRISCYLSTNYTISKPSVMAILEVDLIEASCLRKFFMMLQ